MKIELKTRDEIELIRKSGEILTKAIGEVGKNIRPGISLLELDKIAEEFIRDNGGIPGCKGYCGFPNTLCLSVNEKVVHGIPNNYILKEGDIISVDSCVLYEGFYSDCTYSYGVGEISNENKKLLNVTKQSLFEGINAAKVGNTIGDIGYNIENYVKKNGFYIVEKYCGHGIGKDIHEYPIVNNFGHKNEGITITNGLVIAIEPIVGATTGKTKTLSNKWDAVTSNKCMSAHFEQTVAFLDDKTIILTDFENCKL